MANAASVRCRLCLVTPPAYEIAAFTRSLSDALAGGDVASLIITASSTEPASLQRAAEAFVPVAAARGVAALIHNDTRVAGRSGADGVHIDSGRADVAVAMETLRGKKIVGVGNIASRHDAMELAEAEPDYLFFGRLASFSSEGIHPKVLDLATWWSQVTIIPAIVMGGASIASVDEAAKGGIEFVALSSAVWEHPGGPGAAVAEVAERLASVREAAE